MPTHNESAMSDLRRILHDDDECHPGLTCADEIMAQQNALIVALRMCANALEDYVSQEYSPMQCFPLQAARAAIAKAEAGNK